MATLVEQLWPIQTRGSRIYSFLLFMWSRMAIYGEVSRVICYSVWSSLQGDNEVSLSCQLSW